MLALITFYKLQFRSLILAGGSGIHRPLKARKVESVAGSEYRATKARGDIKKKGKPDPYVYLPLTRAALNKRLVILSFYRLYVFLYINYLIYYSFMNY